MATEEILIKFKADTKDLNKATNDAVKATKNVEKSADKTTKSVDKLGKEVKKTGQETKSFGTIAKGAFAGIAAAFAVDRLISGLVDFGKELFDTAANLELMERRAKVVFAEALPTIEAEAKKTANQLGLTKNEFIGSAAAVGDLLQPLTQNRDLTAQMSAETLRLGGALKEFTGDSRSTAEISEVVSKAFLGERDGLVSLGIKISELDVQRRLQVKGLADATGRQLQLNKALVTQELLTEKSTDALAAFEAGTKTLADRQEIATAKLREAEEQLAQGLAPAFASITELTGQFTTALADVANARSLSGFAKIAALFNSNAASAAAATVGLEKLADEISKVDDAEKLNNILRQQAIRVKQLEFAYKEGDISIEDFKVGLAEIEAATDQASAAFKRNTAAIKENPVLGGDEEEETGTTINKLRAEVKKFTEEMNKSAIGSDEFKAAQKGLKEAQKALNAATGKGVKTTKDLALAAEEARVAMLALQKEIRGENFESLTQDADQALMKLVESFSRTKDELAGDGLFGDEVFDLEEEAEEIEEFNDRIVADVRESANFRIAILENERKKGLISEEEFQARLLEIQNEGQLARIEKFEEFAAIAGNLLGGLAQIQEQLVQKEINEFEAAQDKKLRAAEGNEQLTEKVKEEGERKRLAIEKKAFKQRQILSLALLAIQLAETIGGIIKNAAANPANAVTFGVAGAIQAAILIAGAVANFAVQRSAINAQKFAKGEIDIDGAGTSTSDSIPALLSRGESVMTAKETKQHKDALLAMRNDTFDQYINDAYVKPLLSESIKEYEKGLGANIMNSVNFNFDDNRITKHQKTHTSLLEILNIQIDNLNRNLNSSKGYGGEL
jgi:hypothetical protein